MTKPESWRAARLWMDTLQGHIKNEGKYTFEELADQYSFQSAYNNGMGPLEAYVDCVNWLES